MAVERTINILKAGAIAAGLGKIAYRELKREGSPIRTLVLDQVANRIGYPKDPKEVDSFLYQIPGRWRTAAIAADVIAHPSFSWEARSVVQPSLADILDEEAGNPQRATAFYLEVKPADQSALHGLYVVREHGDPIQQISVPGRDGTTDFATLRFFIAGRKHIPASLQYLP